MWNQNIKNKTIIFLYFLILSAGSFAFYSPDSYVVELTQDNFQEEVMNSDSIWMIEFYTPWCIHCQELVPEYTKTAQVLKGVAKVGAIDAEEQKTLADKYKIQGFPTIKIFRKKQKPEDYNGKRNTNSLAKAVLAAITKKIQELLEENVDQKMESNVIKLTDSNFDEKVLNSQDMWLIEFYAPLCGHCQNLAPHWEQTASELKGKIMLGALDVTRNKEKAAEFEIEKYPSIKLFPLGKKNVSNVINYNGQWSSPDIVQWSLEQLYQTQPAPEIQQLTKNIFENTNTNPIWVISVLPNILDCQSSCRNNYIDILKAMAEKYKNKLWGWIWCEAGVQSDLENSLDIGGFGYPAMAVINVKKMKFSLLRGSFSKDGINDFLRDISYGKGNTVTVRGEKLPNIVDSKVWDGKDGVINIEDISKEKDEL